MNFGAIGAGLPVMAAVNAGTGRNWIADFGVDNILSITDLAAVFVELGKNILVNCFGKIYKLPGRSVQLPQNAILAHGSEQPLPPVINQDPLKTHFHIDGFTANMLVVPDNLPIIRVQRQCGVGIQGFIPRRHAATGCYPGFGLRGPYIKQVQLGVIAARNPGISPATQARRHT